MIVEDYTKNYLMESQYILSEIETAALDRMIDVIAKVKENGGRIFFLGVGGSAANASHAVNDFRKIAGIECYAPTDNVAELTARTNDDGWDTVFDYWLKTNHLCGRDAIFILSVGGGTDVTSSSIKHAIRYAKEIEISAILAIIGKTNGYAAKEADEFVIIPKVDVERVTPHTESMQSLLLHLIVTHPKLR